MASSAATFGETGMTDSSAALFERARRVLPRGNSRHSIFFEPHPLYCAHAAGSTVTDVDGVTRTDFINNFSSLIHGHGRAEVKAAIQAQLDRVIATGLPTETEVRLAELLCRRVKSVAQVRFANSGSEAVMMAIKAARAFTDRPLIAKFEGCYHGIYDPVEVSQAPAPDVWGPADAPASVALSRGVPAGLVHDTLVLPFNDAASARSLLRQHADRLAGIIVDTTPAHLGYIQISPHMVELLNEVTAGPILLIADEVYSLRLGYRGSQDRFGLEPDITVMGKIIGGGLPVGAIGGREDVMAVFDPLPRPAVAHGGTFNANPLTMAAGLASMECLTEGALATLEQQGDRLREGLARAVADNGGGAIVEGLGSLVSLTFGSGPIRNYRERAAQTGHGAKVKAFHRGMLDAGILITPQGFAILSTAMSDDDIDGFVAAAARVLEGMR